MTALERYFDIVQQQIAKLRSTQWPAIARAAEWLGEALATDHWLYAFGTGHSHALAEEIFYRAGGLAHAVPILDAKLMLHDNAIEATYLEREEGYAARLLDLYPVAAGDVLIVASNSGRNFRAKLTAGQETAMPNTQIVFHVNESTSAIWLAMLMR